MTRRRSAGWIGLSVAALAAAADGGAAKGTLRIADGWMLRPGDDRAWSAPDLPSEGWRPVKTGVPWERAGYPDLDGFAWYRARVEIPADWRSRAGVRKFGGVILALGRIDDVDETFFNGEPVGSTGGFPPDYDTKWNEPRRYFVDASLIAWGRSNVVAVRVYDGNGLGGMAAGTPAIEPAAEADCLDVEFAPAAPGGVWAEGDRLAAVLRVGNRARVVIKASAKLTWATDRLDRPRTLDKERRRVTIPPGGTVSATFWFDAPRPGFYRARIRLGRGPPVERRLVLGSAIDRVKRALNRAEDFDEFWRTRLAELAAVDPEFVVRPDPGRSTDEVAVHRVEMRGHGGVRIGGWYTVPRREGPFAAYVSLPGYGGAQVPHTWEKALAVLALDIRGHGVSRKDLDPAGREFMWIGMGGPPEDYVYVGAFMDGVRGVDFLASRPEVDAERIGVHGGSQGGGLSLATAALDERIRAVTADVPWLCDWPDYATTASWAIENYPKFITRRGATSWEAVHGTLSYVDVMNLADRIRCPVFVSLGLVDDVCPPRTILAAYNRIEAPKRLATYPFGGHEGGGTAHRPVRSAWLKARLGVIEP